ncbi:hypothetical protein HYC85_013081 [Camellia sinensis]|uniref:Uncharacterized protein n=1 Tax=Camellia sinensis TaxID=4442 RepID=A0A7J7HGJ4_CAMSI|nr:hypothetical protein HYC85_013081 [Camellia sinensis]
MSPTLNEDPLFAALERREADSSAPPLHSDDSSSTLNSDGRLPQLLRFTPTSLTPTPDARLSTLSLFPPHSTDDSSPSRRRQVLLTPNSVLPSPDSLYFHPIDDEIFAGREEIIGIGQNSIM